MVNSFAADASLIEADANKQNSTPKEDWDVRALNPDDAPRAVKEYPDVPDDAALGAAITVESKLTSHSAPSSQWTAARKGPAFFAYSTNYLIDTDYSVIVPSRACKHTLTGRGCRSDTVNPTGRGWVRAHDAGASRRSVWPSPRAAHCGCGLWIWSKAGLAREARYQAAHSGARSVWSQG